MIQDKLMSQMIRRNHILDSVQKKLKKLLDKPEYP